MQIFFFGDDQYSEQAARSLFAKIKVHTIITKQRDNNPLIPFAKSHNINLSFYPELPPLPKDAQGVLASFGAILPGELINKFHDHGILCLHPSLLPQYRGATPAQHAIARGDKETGITLFRLTSKIDQGEIIAQAKEQILKEDTTETLLKRLFTIGSKILIDYLYKKETSHIKLDIPKSDLIFTRRFTKDTGYIPWETLQMMLKDQKIDAESLNNTFLKAAIANHSSSYAALIDLIRALTPWPTVWTIIKTTKGDKRASVMLDGLEIKFHLAGKPSPISQKDLTTYYLHS